MKTRANELECLFETGEKLKKIQSTNSMQPRLWLRPNFFLLWYQYEEFPLTFRNEMPSRGVKTTDLGIPNMHDDNRNINDE